MRVTHWPVILTQLLRPHIKCNELVESPISTVILVLINVMLKILNIEVISENLSELFSQNKKAKIDRFILSEDSYLSV